MVSLRFLLEDAGAAAVLDAGIARGVIGDGGVFLPASASCCSSMLLLEFSITCAWLKAADFLTDTDDLSFKSLVSRTLLPAAAGQRCLPNSVVLCWRREASADSADSAAECTIGRSCETETTTVSAMFCEGR